MTTQLEVKSNKNYHLVHNHGFVGLVDVMGSDARIEQAARVSYQKGTRKVSDTRALIRYLVKHQHGSPLEMGVLLFHMKMPIFVARQLIRHRIVSLNEMSARYSELPEETYIPEQCHLKTQSSINKQGGSDTIFEDSEYEEFKDMMQKTFNASFDVYHEFLKKDMTREQARIVLPLATYTEWYWQINLRSLFNFLNLRMDSHAQYETRVYANAIYQLTLPHFPIAIEALSDYIRFAEIVSAPEMHLLDDIILYSNEHGSSFRKSYFEIASHYSKSEFLKQYNLSQREFDEFENRWKLTNK